jgi:hypothetical protein
MNLAAVLLLVYPMAAVAGPAASGFPFADEALTYNITWPSGLSLGEAKLSAKRNGDNWGFFLAIDASVPGYDVKDFYRAVAGLNLCSAEFDRETLHGAKRTSEKTVIGEGKAVRQTVGGGKSEIALPVCGHDALTYLFFARQQLGQGKVPAAETIVFGGGYRLALQYMGAQSVTVGSAAVQADRVVGSVSLRDNQRYEFEVFFARDAARTPVLIRAPFALGAISMELVR